MTIPQNIISRLNELPIEEVACKLGLEVRKHKTLCFKHNDHNPSITFSQTKNIYKCWVCGLGGGPIKLVQDKEGWNFQEACVWLGREFIIWWPKENKYRNTFKKTVKKVWLPINTQEFSLFDEEIYTWLTNFTTLTEPANIFLFQKRHLRKRSGTRITYRFYLES